MGVFGALGTLGPFGALDELSCYLDSAAEPNNVHLEAWLPGRIDADRLRLAVVGVLAALPSARRRRVRPAWWQRSYVWEVPSEADFDPVTVTSWKTEPDLAIARARFLARAPELDQAPVFRLLLASGPERDCLIMNAHHAAFDGRSCELLLRHIAAAYGDGDVTHGVAHGDVAHGDVAHGDVAHGDAAGGGSDGSDGGGTGGGGAPRLGTPTARPESAVRSRERRVRDRGRPVRVAAQAAGRRAPGYGYVLLPWPGIPTATGGERATVNDLLIAALITTIAGWNADHGRRPGPIRLSMPIDTRPPGHEGDLGNLSRISPVTAVAGPDLLTHVTTQTAAARQPDVGHSGTGQPTTSTTTGTSTTGTGTGTGTGQPIPRERGIGHRGARQSGAQVRLVRLWLPSSVKRRVYRVAVHLIGAAYSDTSLLTNLGHITDPPVFGGLVPDRMWFSTSAHMPRGISVGAISVGGRLHLCFRHRYALLDDDAARALAAQYAECLTYLSRVTPPPTA